MKGLGTHIPNPSTGESTGSRGFLPEDPEILFTLFGLLSLLVFISLLSSQNVS